MAGLDATETGNELSQPKFQFTSLPMVNSTYDIYRLDDSHMKPSHTRNSRLSSSRSHARLPSISVRKHARPAKGSPSPSDGSRCVATAFGGEERRSDNGQCPKARAGKMR